MLRELANPGQAATTSAPLSPQAPSSASPRGPAPLRLLILHGGDSRLAALDPVLADLGYQPELAASAEDAAASIDLLGPPDVLLSAPDHAAPQRGIAFARDSLARWPVLRVVYVAWLPWSVPPALGPRERVLHAPFTGAQLAAALAGPA